LRIERESDGQLEIVRTAAQIESCLNRGVFAALMHVEGAEAIDPDLNALEVFHAAGLRSLGPVWSRPNIFGEGVPFRFPHSPDTGPGLTDAGKALVHACNRLRMVIDLSHLNEQGFWDVARLSDAPLVATHSNVHAICPTTRNLTDKQLDAIRESWSIDGLNFGVGDLREDRHKYPNIPHETMVQNIDYITALIGIDDVALGTDFDGTDVPEVLSDATRLPLLLQALKRRGYSDDALERITHGNFVRVLREVWR